MKELRIDNQDLELLKKHYYRYFYQTPISGISEIIAGCSLILTLLTANYNRFNDIINTLIVIFIIIIVIYSISMGIMCIVKNYKSRKYLNVFLESLYELDKQKIHKVAIILIKNNLKEGRYLLLKNTDWNCYLFPSYNITDDVVAEVDMKRKAEEMILRDTGIHTELRYLAKMNPHIKMCYGEKKLFRYQFIFYSANTTGSYSSKKYYYNGNYYKWVTLNAMHKNKDMMRKNGDVIKFVEEKESIPHN